MVSSPTAVEVKRRKFTVAEYYKMAEVGILAIDERVELIDGVIFNMPPMGDWHGGIISRTNRLFVTRFLETAFLRPQCPIRMGDLSLLEPDIALLRFDVDDYTTRTPTSDDVYLLVEISDTSLSYDRGRKLRLYARHGIAEYWIVDRRAAVIEVYRQPTPQGYAEALRFGPGESLSPAAIPGVQIGVDEILR